MREVRIARDQAVPCLGQGTWNMGERPERRADEIAALRAGVELGLTVIDTAEMYGDGATEELVGEALVGIRDEVFLVSKAYPQNASRDRLERACDESLRRLRTDRLDLYLLHWRGRVPLAETVEAMRDLVEKEKIRSWGVSNLDVGDMEELVAAGGSACATDQILYNLSRRGAELELLPWLADHGVSAMAYSPVEQGRLVDHEVLGGIAEPLGLTAAQLALAWILQRPGVIAIPKAGTVEHVRQNRASAEVELSPDVLLRLDAAFPPPKRRVRLEML
jgi:diketogulonate reductase-like aldo/keto reductase